MPGHYSKFGAAFVVWITLGSGFARAGIVIEINSDVDVSNLRRLSVAGNDVIVESSAGSHRITLPPGALPLVALWARNFGGGPLVFSGEIAAVTSSNERYWPPNTPPALVEALFAYDGDHASLTCGAVPRERSTHPLIARAGDESQIVPLQG